MYLINLTVQFQDLPLRFSSDGSSSGLPNSPSICQFIRDHHNSSKPEAFSAGGSNTMSRFYSNSAQFYKIQSLVSKPQES